MHFSKIVILCYMNFYNQDLYPYPHAIYLLHFFATEASLQCFSFSRSCTFVSRWFNKLSFSLIIYLSLLACHTNSMLRSMWRAFINFTFSDDFISFLIVWMISFKVVSKPSLWSHCTFLSRYFVGIQLDSSCTSQLSCSFNWGNI